MYDRSDPMFMRPLAPLVLPAVYDDVLSYEEWLAKVIQAINEIREYINSTIADIDDLVTSKVNTKTADLQRQINDINNVKLPKVNQAILELQGIVDLKNTTLSQALSDTLKTAKAYTDKAIKDLGNIDKKIQAAKDQAVTEAGENAKELIDQANDLIITVFNKELSELSIDLRAQLASLSSRIDDIIKEYPRLYDPATGKSEDMQTLIYAMFGSLRYFGAKAYKYDNQELTADEYDGRCLSAEKYDLYFDMLVIRELFTMFDPFTGKKSSIRDVLAGLVRRLQWNGKTSSQFDGFQATAGEIDASTFDAYEQDTNQYITGTTPDLKNRSYRNWLFLGSGNSITVPDEMLHDESQFAVLNDDGDITYIDTVAGTYGSITITYNSGVFTITGSGIRVYSVTRVFDVSELDK